MPGVTYTEICPQCSAYAYRCHFGYWLCLNCNHHEGTPPGFSKSN
jgi:ribosomal protein L37AE/L43A